MKTSLSLSLCSRRAISLFSAFAVLLVCVFVNVSVARAEENDGDNNPEPSAVVNNGNQGEISPHSEPLEPLEPLDEELPLCSSIYAGFGTDGIDGTHFNWTNVNTKLTSSCKTANWKYLEDDFSMSMVEVTTTTNVTFSGTLSAGTGCLVYSTLADAELNITLDNVSGSDMNCGMQINKFNEDGALNLSVVGQNTIWGVISNIFNIAGNGTLVLSNGSYGGLTANSVSIATGVILDCTQSYVEFSVTSITNNGTIIIPKDSSILDESEITGSGSVQEIDLTITFDTPPGTTAPSPITVEGNTFEFPEDPTVHDAEFIGWCFANDTYDEGDGAVCDDESYVAGDEFENVAHSMIFRALYKEDAPNMTVDFISPYRINNTYAGAEYKSPEVFENDYCYSVDQFNEISLESMFDITYASESWVSQATESGIALYTCPRNPNYFGISDNGNLSFDGFLESNVFVSESEKYIVFVTCPNGAFGCLEDNGNALVDGSLKVSPIASGDAEFTDFDVEIGDNVALNKLFDISIVDDSDDPIALVSPANVYILKALTGLPEGKVANIIHKHGEDPAVNLGLPDETRGENIKFQTDNFSLFGIAYTDAPVDNGGGEDPASKPQDVSSGQDLAETGVSPQTLLWALLAMLVIAGGARVSLLRLRAA